jgi:XrtJ-associated TM-motif-TM protein
LPAGGFRWVAPPACNTGSAALRRRTHRIYGTLRGDGCPATIWKQTQSWDPGQRFQFDFTQKETVMLRWSKFIWVILFLAVTLPLRAQEGCEDSPEAPTIVLALVVGAGAFLTRRSMRIK